MINRIAVPFLAALACLSAASLAQLVEVPTDMTYQGRLTDNGQPFEGIIDLQFAFYETATGGLPLGPANGEIIETSAMAADGVFTATINPGVMRLGENVRWLEVRVRPSGGGAFQTLSPRQRLTSAPFAVQARGAVSQSDRSVTFRDGGLTLAISGSQNTDTDTNSVWQSFVALGTAQIETARFSLRTGEPYTPTSPGIAPVVNIYEGTGTGGALLGKLIDTAPSGSSWSFMLIQASDGPILTQGQTYTAQIVLNDGDTALFAHSNANPYADGRSGFGAGDDLQFSLDGATNADPLTELNIYGTLRHAGKLSLWGNAYPPATLTLYASSLDASAIDHDDLLVADDTAFNDSRSSIGLYGSQPEHPARVTLSQTVAGLLDSKWGIAHAGSSNGSRLDFSYGASGEVQSNAVLASLTPAGDLGLGTDTPLANAHVATSSLALNPAGVSGDSVIVSGTDAVLGLYSRNIGAWGSLISLKDVNSGGDLIDNWSIIRGASPGSDLYFKFGSNANGANNPTVMQLEGSSGTLLLGNAPDTSGRLVITQSTDQNTGGLALYDLNNSHNLRLFIDTANEVRFDSGAAGTGSMRLNAGGGQVIIDNLVTPSTAAIKADIATLTDALATLLQLRGVSYTKKLDGEHDIGFIAEEMATVLPEVVAFDDEGNPIGIEYAKITALTVEAIKQQQSHIALLQSTIRDNTSRMDRLEAIIDRLTNEQE